MTRCAREEKELQACRYCAQRAPCQCGGTYQMRGPTVTGRWRGPVPQIEEKERTRRIAYLTRTAFGA